MGEKLTDKEKIKLKKGLKVEMWQEAENSKTHNCPFVFVIWNTDCKEGDVEGQTKRVESDLM